MKEISMPKLEIARILNNVNVEGLTISKYQKRPEKFTTFPVVTYRQIGDSIKRQFGEMVILKETYGFQICVYGNKSSDVSKITQEIKKQMLLAGYRYINGGDAEDTDAKYKFILEFERSV